MPSGASPAAMAPEETRTTSRPASRTATRASTRAAMRSGSMPPPVVSDDEPTLTTTRCAAATADRSSTSGTLGSCLLVVGGVAGRVVLAVPLPAAGDGGALRGLQPVVLAAPAEDLRADFHLRGEVEDDRPGPVGPAADGDAVTGPGAQLQQLVLDPDPVEPVGQVPDGLRVAEVGLTDPALGLV